VLEQARDELLDWRGGGMSVMEISHRSKAFVACRRRGGGRPARAAGDSRRLQGAVHAGRRDGQFAAMPDEPGARRQRRRLRQHRRLVEEGHRRGRHYCKVNVAADAAATGYCDVPARSRLEADAGAPTCTTRRTRPSAASSFPFVPQRRRAAGGRHVLDDPVAADRCQPLRR
jgi:phosphoserine aminotransferase